jgi:hypothetical protein
VSERYAEPLREIGRWMDGASPATAPSIPKESDQK